MSKLSELITNNLRYWDFRSGTADDLGFNAVNGTLTNTPEFIKEGIKLDSDDSDYVSFGDVLDVGASQDFSFFAWARTQANCDILAKTLGSAPLYRLSVTSSKALIRLNDGVGANIQSVGTTNINNGAWHFLVGTFDRDGNQIIYVDKVAEDSDSIAAVGNLDNTGDFAIGRFGSASTAYMKGSIACVGWYPGILTQTDINELYTETHPDTMRWPSKPRSKTMDNIGANNQVQYATSWGTPVTISNLTAGQLSDTDFQITSGTWKISTDTINGNKVKVFECVTAGVIYAPFGVLNLNQSEAAYGTWKWWIYKDKDANLSNVQFISDEIGNESVAGQDCYTISLETNESIRFRESTAGTPANSFITAASYINFATWYGFKVTRSLAGEFSTYIKGGSFGDSYTLVNPSVSGTNPFTDTTITTGKYIIFDLDAGDKVAIADIKGHHSINKYLGVI